MQTINGGDGNDTIVVLDGQFIDDVVGGPGIDVLNLSDIVSLAANVNLTTGTWDLTGGFPGPRTILTIDNVFGTQLGDTINGNNLDNSFSGVAAATFSMVSSATTL